jgi:hypothetical protein
MELRPSSEDAKCAATQELPSVLWNPKVHYVNRLVSKMLSPVWNTKVMIKVKKSK